MARSVYENPWVMLNNAGFDAAEIGDLIPHSGTPVTISITVRYEENDDPGGDPLLRVGHSVIAGAENLTARKRVALVAMATDLLAVEAFVRISELRRLQ